MNNLLRQLKNVYDYILDIDNCLRLVVKMVETALCLLTCGIATRIFIFVYYDMAPVVGLPYIPPSMPLIEFDIPMLFYFNLYLLMILLLCLLIKKYLGNNKVLSFFLVIFVFMMFFFFVPNFPIYTLGTLYCIWLKHYIEKFFEFEEYNHPPNNY